MHTWQTHTTRHNNHSAISSMFGIESPYLSLSVCERGFGIKMRIEFLNFLEFGNIIILENSHNSNENYNCISLILIIISKALYL